MAFLDWPLSISSGFIGACESVCMYVCIYFSVHLSIYLSPSSPPSAPCLSICFRRNLKGWFSKRVVLADVPPERKPERGYVRMLPRNENRSEGTFACSPGTKTGTRAHSPKPPFYETALLSPSDVFTLSSCLSVLCILFCCLLRLISPSLSLYISQSHFLQSLYASISLSLSLSLSLRLSVSLSSTLFHIFLSPPVLLLFPLLCFCPSMLLVSISLRLSF